MKQHLGALLRGLLILLPTALIGAVVAGVIGALGAMLLVCLLLLLRQNHYLARVRRWAGESATVMPSTWGAWGETLYALERRARAEAERRDELERGLERFRRAAEALPEGVVILDGQRRIEWINAQAESCLGLVAARDRGNLITHLLREPDFLAYLESGGKGAPLQLRTRRNPGHCLQMQLAPFAEARTLLLVRDVTQLERLATMRRDFVANVSHELKTPLTVTLGFIETAQDALTDTPPAEIAEYLATAGDQARRMQRLIDDLLTLSALETDAPPPREESISVADLLGEVRSETMALSSGRHTVEVSPPPAAVALRGASRELHSAFLNLASNAVRYTPDGGRIGLAWRARPDGGGEFCVKDSGIGIAPEHIGRLTERFYRVDRGRSRESGGTGLGLAIVKHVLERHGAVLRVSSTPGSGSEFCVEFPPVRVATGGATTKVSAGGTAL